MPKKPKVSLSHLPVFYEIFPQQLIWSRKHNKKEKILKEFAIKTLKGTEINWNGFINSWKNKMWNEFFDETEDNAKCKGLNIINVQNINNQR